MFNRACTGRDSNPQTLDLESSRSTSRRAYAKYPWSDSNRHAVTHLILSETWLPITPQGRVVRVRGLEPPKDFSHQILNLACIPFHHTRKSFVRLAGLEPA